MSPAAGLDWLDVGCGNGAFTEEVVAMVAPGRVGGVDPSEEQLAFARRRPVVQAVEFTRGDAQSLPFDDASWDIAVMALVISFVPQPENAVAELYRVVRPGGLFSAYMWDIPGGGVPVNPIYRAMSAMGLGAPTPPNPEISRMESLLALWRSAGLEDVEGRVIDIEVMHPDFDAFWETNTLPIGPHGKVIQALPSDVRSALRERVRALLPPAADGTLSFRSFANAVKGHKPG